MKFKKSLLICSALIAIPHAAQAQDSASEVDALRAEVAALKEQLAAVAAKVDEAAKAKEKKSSAPEVKWKGAPELEGEGGWSFKPRGRLLYDVANVSAPSAINDRGLGFSNELRRARLGVQGTIPGGFGYKFEADIATGDAEITDAYLDYNHKGLTVTVGQHNNFQSLEELSSSNDTSFLERAAFTDAFGFERRVGVSVQYGTGAFLAEGGVFTDNISDLGSDENNSIGVDGRLVFMPKLGKTQLHFGGSVHLRELNDAATSVRYRQRPLVHSTDTRFIDTGSVTATSETSYGLETAIIAGRFHAAAEGHWVNVARPGVNVQDANFFGGSLEGGVFLTNDTRGYKAGMFRGVKVKNPVGQGGFGALQFNVRYDYLDLNDGPIVGGKQDSYQASLIWTPIDYLRFMINYAKMDYSDAAIAAGTDRDYSVDVVGARAQVTF
ncbi:porin [Sphingorhabdus arenilitoris]|uniref:Porin n=1 Tax=Sphingorhabdus arenilitoris TaxID=1490041 RepID=A0ABV8RHJ6_9SPHN